jgi:hypothetical protein
MHGGVVSGLCCSYGCMISVCTGMDMQRYGYSMLQRKDAPCKHELIIILKAIVI